MANTQSVSFTFQDASGNPIVNGTATFKLSYDISAASSNGPQVVAGRNVSVTLDSTGSCTVILYRTDILVPSGAVYYLTVYTAAGEPVYSEQITVGA